MTRIVTIVAEDYPTTVDFTDAIDAARVDQAVSEIRLVEAGLVRRIWRRDVAARGGWTVERLA